LHSSSLLRFDRFLPTLRKTIGRKRFLHSLGAMHYAVALAQRYGEDTVRAATAGLLHDCGRLRQIEQIEAETRRRAVHLPPEDRPFVKVWHAWLSADMAATDYGVADEAVLQAIRLHPTGDARMSSLEKIIFLADYIEPTRQFEGLNELRALAEDDLDSALRRALETKIRYIHSQGRSLNSRSLRALEDLGGPVWEVAPFSPPEKRHDESLA